MSGKIYVGNLPYSVTDSTLESNFAEFGSVSSAKVMMDRETGRSDAGGFRASNRADVGYGNGGYGGGRTDTGRCPQKAGFAGFFYIRTVCRGAPTARRAPRSPAGPATAPGRPPPTRPGSGR